MLTSIIEKAKTLKNKEQILNYLYKMYYKENERILSDFESRQMLEEIKANNFSLAGKELPINPENLVRFGFKNNYKGVFFLTNNSYSIKISFDNGLDKHALVLEIELVYSQCKNSIEFLETNLKTMLELKNLIFYTTNIQIKPKEQC